MCFQICEPWNYWRASLASRHAYRRKAYPEALCVLCRFRRLEVTEATCKAQQNSRKPRYGCSPQTVIDLQWVEHSNFAAIKALLSLEQERGKTHTTTKPTHKQNRGLDVRLRPCLTVMGQSIQVSPPSQCSYFLSKKRIGCKLLS